MKKLFLGILLICSLNFLYSQDIDTTLTDPKLAFHLSYYGNNIWNPGIKTGFEYLLKTNKKYIIRKSGETEIKRIKKGHYLLEGNLGFYWDPRSHVGAFTYYGVSWRRTRPRGFRFKVGLSPLGYYRSFLPDTYEVDDAGNVTEVSFPGNNYYAPVVTLGIGKDRRAKENRPVSWHLNINAMFLMPYNNAFVPLLHLELGFGI